MSYLSIFLLIGCYTIATACSWIAMDQGESSATYIHPMSALNTVWGKHYLNILRYWPSQFTICCALSCIGAFVALLLVHQKHLPLHILARTQYVALSCLICSSINLLVRWLDKYFIKMSVHHVNEIRNMIIYQQDVVSTLRVMSTMSKFRRILCIHFFADHPVFQEATSRLKLYENFPHQVASTSKARKNKL